MSSIGPSLPPHLLAKRKRQREENAQSDATTTPGAKRAKTPPADQVQEEKRPRIAGPAPPSGPASDKSSPSAVQREEPHRVVGPAPPPAPLDERPTEPANLIDDENSSDDDDDFGPAPPSMADVQRHNALADEAINRPSRPGPDEQPAKAKRDDWMMIPPKADDLAARMDPSKLRARGFNTGKGAKAPAGPSGGLNSAWTETPEEKLKRLQNEAMGVKGSAATDFDAREYAKSKEREDQARRIRAHTDKNRGQSLIDQHKKVQKIEDDDPSKRAFDREKDIGGGVIGNVQRKEMLKKAGDFSSKFAGGSYL